MHWLYFILIGIVAGWAAGKLVKGSGFGLILDLVVGVIGAVVGGAVFQFLGITATGLLGSLVTATVGAVIFLAVLNLFTGRAKV